MKDLFNIFQLVLFALIFSQCTASQNYDHKKLEELPTNDVRNLKLSQFAPVLATSLSLDVPIDTTINDSIIALAPKKECIRKYWVQLTYPITICYPNNELIGDIVSNALAPSNNDENNQNDKKNILTTPKKINISNSRPSRINNL